MKQQYRVSKIVDESGDPFVVPMRQSGFRAAAYDVVNRWGETDQWQYVTDNTANAGDTRDVRQRVRDAARFEYRNNSYCRGLILKTVNEIIGRAPRLEVTPMSISEDSKRAARQFEQNWDEYTQEIQFGELLRVAATEMIVGGECFCVFRPNRAISIPIDWINYEGDQFQTPDQYGLTPPNAVDGMELDSLGNVVAYHKLKVHPGADVQMFTFDSQYDRISPSVCAHLYRRERPTQYRGVSQLAPCIERFGELRRYTEAVIQTAENAASILGTVETGFSPDVCDEASDGPLQIPMGSGNLMTLPAGWRSNPFKAEQPAQGYAEFKKEILHEISSSLLLPWNVAAGDSSDYNFASGRLDHRIWEETITIIQAYLERVLLNRFFAYWLEFATFVPGVVPTRLGAFQHRWFWDEKVPIDPSRQAIADTTLKAAGLLDENKYWQKQGLAAMDAIDHKLRLEQYELERRQELGLPDEQETTTTETQTS